MLWLSNEKVQKYTTQNSVNMVWLPDEALDFLLLLNKNLAIANSCAHNTSTLFGAKEVLINMKDGASVEGI